MQEQRVYVSLRRVACIKDTHTHLGNRFPVSGHNRQDPCIPIILGRTRSFWLSHAFNQCLCWCIWFRGDRIKTLMERLRSTAGDTMAHESAINKRNCEEQQGSMENGKHHGVKCRRVSPILTCILSSVSDGGWLWRLTKKCSSTGTSTPRPLPGRSCTMVAYELALIQSQVGQLSATSNAPLAVASGAPCRAAEGFLGSWHGIGPLGPGHGAAKNRAARQRKCVPCSWQESQEESCVGFHHHILRLPLIHICIHFCFCLRDKETVHVSSSESLETDHGRGCRCSIVWSFHWGEREVKAWEVADRKTQAWKLRHGWKPWNEKIQIIAALTIIEWWWWW